MLQRNSAAAAMPDSEPDEGDEGLAKLLTPGRMPDSASTAKFDTAGAALGAKEPPGPVDPLIQV